MFRVFWAGEAVSLLGTATTATLIPLLAATELDAGPLWMGVLTAATWSPWLVLGLPAGAVVDQLSPRAAMIGADLIAGAAAGVVPLLWVTGRLSLLSLTVVAFTIGSCAVVFRAALPRMVIRIAPPEQRSAANSRLFATESASTIAGPGIAGLFIQVASAALGLLLDAISFLVSALCLSRIRPATVATTAEREPLRTRILAGVTIVVHDRFLRYFACLATVQNFGLTGLLSLQVLFLADTLAAPGVVIGVVLATGGVGGVVGALLGPRIAGRLGTARGSVTIQLASCSCLLVPLASPGWGVVWMAAGLLVCESAIVADNVIRTTWRMSYVSENLQARVSTTIQLLAFAAMPLAGLVAGWLGHQFGVRQALALMLAVHVAGALTMPFGPVGRRRELPHARETAEPMGAAA